MDSVPEAPATVIPNLDDPSLYMNRELSLLEFQRRVIEEARDPENKLLERVKFASIVSSNLDEFFMVRVAAMKQKLEKGSQDLSIDGKTITEQLAAVRASVDQLVRQLYECFQTQLLPGLAEQGIVIADYNSLDERERDADRPLLSRDRIPRADAARVRSRAALSAYFESQPEPRHRLKRHGRPPALRARESSRSAAATGHSSCGFATEARRQSGRVEDRRRLEGRGSREIRLDRAGDRGQSELALPRSGNRRIPSFPS